ncbi:MAG: ATP-binding protein [Vulcanisaeta sp.]|nr:ATP-binding protein [Vulcanisaeta sp.]
MGRVRLPFLPNLEVEFTDRDRAVRQVEELAVRGTAFPMVIYGPEGCGKSAVLRQAAAMLRELGYEVFYINPLDKAFNADITIPDIKRAFMEFVERALAENALGRIAWAIFDFVHKVLSIRRAKIAVIVDDAFQAIGLQQAAIYVKGLLNLIEYPLHSYENIVILAATSEGISKREIGRHRWAELMTIWNMSKNGFEELYGKIPGPKPRFEDVWRVTGGNPGILRQLYRLDWDVNKAIEEIIRAKGLVEFVRSLSKEEREWLTEAIEDPDALFVRERLPLMHRLVEENLIMDDIYYRQEYLWIDQPPPERDPELGISKYTAWQTPLHREAVRRALKETA